MGAAAFAVARDLRLRRERIRWGVRFYPTTGGGPIIGVLASALVLAGLSGCVATVLPSPVARMPTVLPGPAVGPKPTLTDRAVLGQALEQAGREDVGAMMASLGALSRAERDAVVRALFATIAQEDLGLGVRLVQAMPAGTMLTQATEVVARAMIDRDPGAAVQWALTWLEPETAHVGRQAVAEQWVERDPRAALDHLLALPTSPARTELVSFAVAGWGQRDATAAMAWVHGRPAGEDKNLAARSLAFALAQVQPERAVEVMEWMPEGRDRWLVVTAIGQTWVARNPMEAWRWAGRLPEAEAREAAFAGIETGLGGARTRRTVDASVIASSAASLGLRSAGGGGGAVDDPRLLPPGAERERELRRKFDEALAESPVRASIWLASLPLPDRRDEMIDDLARRWLTTDPSAARNWMEQTILSNERKAQLLREAGR